MIDEPTLGLARTWHQMVADLQPLDEELRFRVAIVKENLWPVLDDDLDRARTITTVSGGALVASVSLFQFFSSKPISGEWALD